MSWFDKLFPSRRIRTTSKRNIPEGLWSKCPACQAVLFRAELERNLHVCPKCDHHLRIGARTRLLQLFDDDAPMEIGEDIAPVDWVKFKDTKRYKDRLVAAQKATGENDALLAMTGPVHGRNLVACAFEFGFIGGSMGAVVGEKFVRAVNHAIEHQLPFVCFATSGGARMQESLISLMQMSKTSAALAKLREKGLPYISIMVDPCMGGVSASLAMLGDINLAEPNALIGFAGPRVIEQTVREKLPEGFQRSEFLLEHGMVDQIVSRQAMKGTISRFLDKLMKRPINPEILTASPNHSGEAPL